MAAGGNGESAEKRQGGKIDIIPGCQVWCKTEFEEIQGTVAAYDPNFGVLVIKSTPNDKNAKPNSVDVSIVNVRHLQKTNFQLVSMPKGSTPLLSELDFSKVSKKLRDAVSEKNKKAESTGVNVSQEAQALFYSIAHFMPECKWNGENIIVMDDVKIEPPYQPDNCSGQRKDSLEQIRKMVEKFHSERQSDN